VILVTKESFVKEDNQKKPGKICIAIGTLERVFFMYTETPQENQDWLQKLSGTIERLKGTGGGSTGTNGGGTTTQPLGGSTSQPNGQTNTGGTNGLTNTGGTNGQTNTGGTTGQPLGGTTGQPNTGGTNGQTNTGGSIGQTNTGGTTGQPLGGTTGQTNTGGTTGQTNTGGTTPQTGGTTPQTGGTTPQTGGTTPQTGGTTTGQSSGGVVLVKAKEFVPFMIDDSNKVLEFWNIWFDSIPKPNEIPPNTFPNYQLIVSCDGNELSWRASGSQNIFIQKMVDFFWNVGAPESEIDRLNDFGALVNPASIGSWINMSKIGGMDGGWFFPVPLSLKIAMEACDPDNPEQTVSAGSEENQTLAVKTFISWTESNKIDECIYVGRDMGAAPPRQTELRLRLNQTTVAEQLNVALSAFKTFKFPDIPTNILNILRQFTNPGLVLSVITSSEGFVKIGVLFPNPNWNIAIQLIEEGRKLCDGQPAPVDIFNKLNTSFKTNPEFIEFQYLNPGFGYNVYKEEFNVFIHYHGL